MTKSSDTKKRKVSELSANAYYSTQVGKWSARSVDDLNLFLGHFDTEKKAKQAILDYAKVYGDTEKKPKKSKNTIY